MKKLSPAILREVHPMPFPHMTVIDGKLRMTFALVFEDQEGKHHVAWVACMSNYAHTVMKTFSRLVPVELKTKADKNNENNQLSLDIQMPEAGS